MSPPPSSTLQIIDALIRNSDAQQRGDRRGLLTGRKAGQAVGVHVHAQRIDRRDQHVQAQIELAAVDQQRPLDVSARGGWEEGGCEGDLVWLMRTFKVSVEWQTLVRLLNINRESN